MTTRLSARADELFVDTSVWSLAFRRDAPPGAGEVKELLRGIEAGEEFMTTGLVLQELLQGFSGRETVRKFSIGSPPFRF